jgi:hypothetical protein
MRLLKCGGHLDETNVRTLCHAPAATYSKPRFIERFGCLLHHKKSIGALFAQLLHLNPPRRDDLH